MSIKKYNTELKKVINEFRNFKQAAIRVFGISGCREIAYNILRKRSHKEKIYGIEFWLKK